LSGAIQRRRREKSRKEERGEKEERESVTSYVKTIGCKARVETLLRMNGTAVIITESGKNTHHNRCCING
jgi:hypothetical protein